jgi:hypothetical protein
MLLDISSVLYPRPPTTMRVLMLPYMCTHTAIYVLKRALIYLSLSSVGEAEREVY